MENCNHNYDNDNTFEFFDTYYSDSITLAHEFKCRLCGKIINEYEPIDSDLETIEDDYSF